MNAQVIGWTLIHSIWQGLLIFLVIKVASRFINRADVRYGVGVVGMILIVITSVVTFFVLQEKSGDSPYHLVLDLQNTTVSGSQPSVQTVLQFIDQNIIWLIRFWVLGFVVGLVRIAAGLWYIGRLRRTANAVQDEWMDMVKKLSEALNINRVVAMAEAQISSPMVVGFMKPIILFPVGLLSGLSTEQVETILVHELSHIRRQDYIINLVQSVIETIFFFNPFVLLMSSAIREERENCCDDMVIAKGISPISYVKTLAQLEAARSSSTLALGFAGNQNQLLNRIKRIMENSAKNDWGKGRLAPVALLFLGLVCASWLSISSEKEINEVNVTQLQVPNKIAAKDTSREDGLVVIKRGRKHGDWVAVEPVEPADIDMDIELEFPPMPDLAPMEFEIPEFPPMPEIPADFAFEFDSIPGVHFKNDPEWVEFEKEFTDKFKTQFKEFYEKNQAQFDKMMDEMHQEEAYRREAAKEVDLDQLRNMADIERKRAMDMADAFHWEKTALDIGRIAELQHLEQSKDMLQLQKLQMDMMKDQLQKEHYVFEDMHRKNVAYQEELIKLLKEDGYIKKDDDSGSLSIMDNNGELTINGQKIKEVHALKYRALRDSYFGPTKRVQRDSYRRQE